MDPLPTTRAPSLLTFVRRYQTRIALGAVLLLATNLCQIAIPWAVARGIDTLAAGQPLALAQHYALMILGLAILQAVIRIGSRVALFHAGRNIEYDLRQGLFTKILTLAPADLRRRSTGDIMSAMTSDLSSVRVMTKT